MPTNTDNFLRRYASTRLFQTRRLGSLGHTLQRMGGGETSDSVTTVAGTEKARPTWVPVVALSSAA